METERDGQGVYPPVTGLAPTIVVEAGGVRSTYQARETEPGVYVADHSFTVVGPTTLTIRFTGTGGGQHEWSLPITVQAHH